MTTTIAKPPPSPFTLQTVQALPVFPPCLRCQLTSKSIKNLVIPPKNNSGYNAPQSQPEGHPPPQCCGWETGASIQPAKKSTVKSHSIPPGNAAATDVGTSAISSMVDPSRLKDNASAQLRSPSPDRPRPRPITKIKEEKRSILETV